MTQHYPSQPIPHWKKDEDKIQKIIELCKQLGVQYCIQENAKDPENVIMIKVPYKKVFICEVFGFTEYKEKRLEEEWTKH